MSEKEAAAYIIKIIQSCFLSSRYESVSLGPPSARVTRGDANSHVLLTFDPHRSKTYDMLQYYQNQIPY